VWNGARHSAQRGGPSCRHVHTVSTTHRRQQRAWPHGRSSQSGARARHTAHASPPPSGPPAPPRMGALPLRSEPSFPLASLAPSSAPALSPSPLLSPSLLVREPESSAPMGRGSRGCASEGRAGAVCGPCSYSAQRARVVQQIWAVPLDSDFAGASSLIIICPLGFFAMTSRARCNRMALFKNLGQPLTYGMNAICS
jgi:hypothetical protein